VDNITHALAGSLMAAAACQHVHRPDDPPPRAFRTAAWTIGIVMAELPDVDIFYSGDALGMGRLGYLLHHRGHTHTIVFALAVALVAWRIALLLGRNLRAPQYARPLLALSLVASLSHVALDFTNSYGVHPWWPLDSRWIYGDAVFIVEPWFWIVAIPPLVLIVRSALARLLLVALLAIILVAAWRVDIVGAGVAAALTAGALIWAAVSWGVPAARRVSLGIVGWLALEAIFFAGGAAGRASVRRAVGSELRDVVLSPLPGNPLCLSAIVVTAGDGMYVATKATVAPAPALRSAAACNAVPDGGADRARAGRPAHSPAIRWGGEWRAPVAELQALAAERCEVSAALRFIRVPIWRRAPNGDVTLFDLRYGDGEDSFTTIVSSPGQSCDWSVPGWAWPRRDLLRAG
jgi:inner membrane protein